jgi:hypothetical protein
MFETLTTSPFVAVFAAIGFFTFLVCVVTVVVVAIAAAKAEEYTPAPAPTVRAAPKYEYFSSSSTTPALRTRSGPRSAASWKVPVETKVLIQEALAEGSKSTNEIASEFKVSNTFVRKIKKNGI